MVKFLCTRQDTAERLGVQQMSFSGYLCPDSERLEDVEDLSAQTEENTSGLVMGLTLMKKTLYFIQQLTRDMVHPPNPSFGIPNVVFSFSIDVYFYYC